MMLLCIFCLILSSLVIYIDRGRIYIYIKEVVNFYHDNGIIKTLRRVVFVLNKSFKIFLGGLIYRNKYDDNVVHIAFHPTGGLGDYIVSASVLEELQAVCNTEIDVYVEKYNFGLAVYGHRDKVNVKSYNELFFKMKSYDLVLEIEHLVHVVYWRPSRILTLSKELYYIVKTIFNSLSREKIDFGNKWNRERLHFERCRLLGINRWTELRMEGAFKILSTKVNIPLLDSYNSTEVDGYFLDKQYITVNWGTDKLGSDKIQLKLWPLNNIEDFIYKFKIKYPNIKIIQLGDNDAYKLTGCDAFILGKSIELIKWILKRSLCHIDCEGGLVHLAKQLNTKCIVLFGPTPMHMYAYPENINLSSNTCQNCMGLSKKWAYNCINKKNPHICLKLIKAEEVLRAFEEYYKTVK